MSSRRSLAAIGFAMFVSLALAARPAGATMTGPCTATVNGQDVAPLSASAPSDAIDVDESDEVAVQARSSSQIGSYRIQLEYAGIRWTVAKGQSTDNTWNRAVKVKDYARYGAGLYRVHGVSDGASTCDGAVLIKVGGSPLTTPVGLVAAGFVVVGLANIAATLRGSRKAVAA